MKLGDLLTKYKSPAVRHYARVMAIAVLAIAVLVSLVYFFPVKPVVYAPVEITPEENTEIEIVPNQFARSLPVRLEIPKIKLDTTFEEPLGLKEDKTVEVPDSFEKVGWYKYGVSPGQIGPAVILGHVDSYKGAAVFYLLGKLEAGDEVIVTREDGTVATFVVTDKERVPQTDFPAQKVYGKIDYAGLRLVTCTGVYNHGTFEYSHNLIVYAKLKE